MPFEDLKPGPVGAESGGLELHTIARDVISAFRAEGLRYIGRIRLARDVGPRPNVTTLGTVQQEPESDSHGNWLVRALRCTSAGDVYRGT
jgi:hypothetical protein